MGKNKYILSIDIVRLLKAIGLTFVALVVCAIMSVVLGVIAVIGVCILSTFISLSPQMLLLMVAIIGLVIFIYTILGGID